MGVERIMGNQGDYYFDGGLLQLIGWNLLGILVTAVTFGICYPWAITMIYSWRLNILFWMEEDLGLKVQL